MQLRAGTAQEAGFSVERIANVKELAASWVSQGATPALVLVVARRGIVVLHEAFGRLTPEPDAPPLPHDAIFPLMSLSKPVTATAAMILVEDGRLGLTRPVAEYIPEFVGEGKAAVMVHHLLTHTSGLRESDLLDYIIRRSEENVQIPPCEATQHPQFHKHLHLGYDAPLWKPPGVEMAYNDYNFDLLGEIVRRVSGKSLEDFAKERIFEPLEMHNSYYQVPESASQQVIKRPTDTYFAEAESPGLAEQPSYMKALMGGLNSRILQESSMGSSGVFSTAMDMAKFGQMFLNRGRHGDKQLLSPPTVVAMTRNQIPGIAASWMDEYFPQAGWGFGWNVQGEKKARDIGTLASLDTFSHSGLGGVTLWVDPVYELVGAFFSVWLGSHDGVENGWPIDLFINCVTAAVSEA